MATPSGNNNQFFGQKVSVPGVNVENAGDNQLILKDDYSSRIYYNSNGVETVLLGLRAKNSKNGLSANQQGLFISQSGIKVTQATDSQLVFNSSQNIFKIVNKITNKVIPSFSIDGLAGHNYSILTVPHGQTYSPLIQVYVQAQFINYQTGTAITTSYVSVPVVQDGSANTYVFPAANGNSYVASVRNGADNTNIYIQASSSVTAATTINDIPVTIFILQETAN